MNHEIAYIAFGSNLGDRAAMIESGLQHLRAHPAIEVLRVSSIIETDPVGVTAQPRFLNCVVEIRTALSPRTLLDFCLDVEAVHGRHRLRDARWGPRTLDLDLLLHGSHVIDEPGLTIPHPRLHERAFVLSSLCELAPKLIHPVMGRRIECLWQRMKDGGT